MLCRAANSSIVPMPTGGPIGEPEKLRCPTMSGITESGIGSSTKPTTCSRPLGASEAMSASQSSGTLTVTSSRSNTPANSLIASELRLDTTRCAPNFRASSSLLSLEGNAVTSRPYAAGNFRAMWPWPPVPASRGGEFPAGVADPADADDAHAAGRLGVHRQRIEHGHAAAQKRASLGDVDFFRQGDGPAPVRADAAGECAIVPDDRKRCLRAQMVIARHALTAVHAAACRPADPDALSDCQPLGRSSDFDHSADGFVPQHGRKLREPPVVVPDRKVGVTQSTVLDLHFHFLVPKRPELDLLPNQAAP